MSVLRLVVLFVALAVPAFAAEAKLTQVENLTLAQQDKVQAIFVQQQRNLMDACITAKVVKANTVSVIQPLVMDASGKPTAGEWRVRYVVNACGDMVLRMAEFKVVAGGIAITALAPGETLADARLQADVIKSFGMAGAVAMSSCTDVPVIRDTTIRAVPKTQKDRWQEVWIGRMCGRDLGQVVEFMPNKNGTTFKMSLPVNSVKETAK